MLASQVVFNGNEASPNGWAGLNGFFFERQAHTGFISGIFVEQRYAFPE